jgi:membrane protease YdiL (CAAX protease family)
MDEKNQPLPSEEQEIPAGGPADDTVVAYRPTEPRVRVVLIAQLAFVLVGAVLGTLFYLLIAAVAGWETGSTAVLGETGLPTDRWQLRTMLALSHFCTFVLAGAACVWLFYRRYVPESGPRVWLTWRDYLGLGRAPRAGTVGLALLLMIAAVPLVLYTYELNRELPLPEFMRESAESANEALKALLRMEHAGELLANLVLVALLPAIGEELIFRGIVQQQLMRRIESPAVALVLSAALFSFVHFQFDGFLPRLVLGLVLGWMYWRTHNLWVPAAAHFFNNGLQVVGQYLYHRELSTVDLEQDITVPWYSAVVSVVLLLLLMRRF